MNIVFFCRLFGPHIGGVEKHVAKISKLLIKKGYKVTVVTEQYSQTLKTEEIINGVKVIRMPGFKNGFVKKFKIWKWFWANRDLIKSADVIHCHDVFFWYLPFRFIFPYKKVFITFHGYENYPLKLKQLLMHKISEKLTMGNICIGDFIQKWYNTKATYLSYGAVDIPKIKNKKSKIRSKSAVFIGRLDVQTGIKTYVKAFNLIKKKNPDFKFTVVGDGPHRDRIPEGIKMLGFKNNPEEYLEKNNFAFVSRYLSILEAMACKRLIFAVYDDPIKEDYLKMAPYSRFIIISDSPSEIASKVNYYLNNPKVKEKMVEQAYFWVKNQTWKKMTDNYLNLWGI